jgi:hypothetical protein
VSYELLFWKQSPVLTKPASFVYDSLMAERHVEGLVDLPIEAILSNIEREFPGTNRERNGPSEWLVWVSQNEMDSFEVTWSHKYVRVDCRHLHSYQMNQLIDIGAKFGCSLFDPQTGGQFTQVEE